MDNLPETPGLYVHIPFCVSRCDYCAFATWDDALYMADAYLDAVLTELKLKWSGDYVGSPSSIFFGGGTPSVIPARQIAKIIETVGIRPGAEITVECNPESTTLEKLKIYKDAGVNRVSLGLQSFSTGVLKSLGRSHNPADIYPVIEGLGEVGFENYSVDLIYGAAGETESVLEKTVQKVLTLSPAPTHISAYALTVEPGTPLGRDKLRHPDEDYQARAYSLIDSLLADAGMEWYEISNWSKPGFYSRHNWNYWMQGEYIGLGCAAHTHRNSKRSWNIFNLRRYIDSLLKGTDPIVGSEEIAGEQKITEGLELLLRTNCGVPSDALTDKEQIESLYQDSVGLATLTLKGRLLANQVALRLDPSKVTFDQIKDLQALTPD